MPKELRTLLYWFGGLFVVLRMIEAALIWETSNEFFLNLFGEQEPLVRLYDFLLFFGFLYHVLMFLLFFPIACFWGSVGLLMGGMATRLTGTHGSFKQLPELACLAFANHPVYAGVRHLFEVDCDLCSIGAIQDALRERVVRTPPGEWVLGFKYDDTKTAERRFLSRSDLVAVSTSHPIVVGHRGEHTLYVSSLAFERAGITESTPDPVGGRFERDTAGRLNGRVAERGADVLRRAVPITYTRTDCTKEPTRISPSLTPVLARNPTLDLCPGNRRLVATPISNGLYHDYQLAA